MVGLASYFNHTTFFDWPVNHHAFVDRADMGYLSINIARAGFDIGGMVGPVGAVSILKPVFHMTMMMLVSLMVFLDVVGAVVRPVFGLDLVLGAFVLAPVVVSIIFSVCRSGGNGQ
jgi:hypothetical protein